MEPNTGLSHEISGSRPFEEMVRLFRRRTENIFSTRQLLCTEAVLSVLNQGLEGELPFHLAVRLASGFPEGLSGGGCICGALNGGVLALGLFLGRDGPGLTNNRQVKAAALDLHDRFRDRFGSTCCRTLTRKFAYGSKAHFRHCAGLTGKTAELAVRIILKARPELADRADRNFLEKTDSRVGAGLRKITRLV